MVKYLTLDIFNVFFSPKFLLCDLFIMGVHIATFAITKFFFFVGMLFWQTIPQAEIKLYATDETKTEFYLDVDSIEFSSPLNEFGYGLQGYPLEDIDTYLRLNHQVKIDTSKTQHIEEEIIATRSSNIDKVGVARSPTLNGYDLYLPTTFSQGSYTEYWTGIKNFTIDLPVVSLE